ncbi:MAG: deaminase [Pseudomonadota bacterium]|nr:deaminase [Pseudomonadota bacterium]
MNRKWDRRFLQLAKHISSWSKDDSKCVGAVITEGKFIRSLGYNGFPVGVIDTWNNKFEKRSKIVHAEANAILSARADIAGCMIYIYPFMPCSTCAGLIIQSGISRIVCPDHKISEFYNPKETFEMLKQAGVSLLLYKETKS